MYSKKLLGCNLPSKSVVLLAKKIICYMMITWLWSQLLPRIFDNEVDSCSHDVDYLQVLFEILGLIVRHTLLDLVRHGIDLRDLHCRVTF